MASSSCSDLSLKITRAVALTRTMGEMALNFCVATMVEMKACRPRVKSECSRASRRENCGLSAKSSIDDQHVEHAPELLLLGGGDDLALRVDDLLERARVVAVPGPLLLVGSDLELLAHELGDGPPARVHVHATG
jgi:hypothetical protein